MIPGEINFIGATSVNNGLTAKISNSEYLHPAGTITVTYNGSVGEAFYQAESFWASDDVNVLYPKFSLNESIALYFLAPLTKKGKGYGYSFKWTKEKMEQDYIVLPVTSKGNIDFDFIEERVRELEEERVRELEAYLKEAGFEDCSLTEDEKQALRVIDCGEKQMCRFSIVKEFNVSNSHSILKSDVVFGSGDTPYVTASEGNNSVVSYISYNQNMMEAGNSIMIGGKTLVITYQPRAFFSNDSHNLVLNVKDDRGRNESVYLYIVAALYKSLGPKYSWGDSISKTKIQNDVVYLPIGFDGESIDFVFMESYINAIKKQCIARLKQEIDRERKAYGQVLDERPRIRSAKVAPVSYNHDNESEMIMVAEPFECYKWSHLDQTIIDFFGNDKTILVGCIKDKKHRDWIQKYGVYNVRLGKTKGSMEKYGEMFDRASLLVLYELDNADRLTAYNIIGHQQMDREELKALGYPNKKLRKSYMTFNIRPLEMDLNFLVNHHLIKKILEIKSSNENGTPIFIEP